MILIAIDDGHGRETPGKRTPDFPNGTVMRENEFNEKTALYLKDELIRCGLKVVMVAPEKEDVPLKTRVQRANLAHADTYISIHANASGTGWNEARGIETWVYSKVAAGSRNFLLAQMVQQALVHATGRKDRGIKRSSDLYVLKNTNMQAVLLECGFMTNREEAELLQNEKYRKICATAICKGICSFYGITYKGKGIEQEGENMKVYEKMEELPFGKNVIEKLVKEGALQGNEKGNLHLSEDMLRTFVVLDRLGVLFKDGK